MLKLKPEENKIVGDKFMRDGDVPDKLVLMFGKKMTGLHPILSLLSNNGFLIISWRIIRLLWKISVGKIVEKGTIVMGALSAIT